jgi:parallel beta-helix repeat protein
MPKLELPIFEYIDDNRSFADKLNELVRQLEYGINREKSTTSVNFNMRNDRDSNAIVLPTIAGDGTALIHTIATDGSADIACLWGWAGNNADIDGWIVYVHQSTTDAEYNFGDNSASERSIKLPPEKRVVIINGPADKYYTFGVQAYRRVDPDVDADGVIVTAIVKPAAVDENPYRPSENVEYTGNINGVDASVVSAVAANFNTRNDRISATPADPVIAGDSYTKSLLHMNGTNGSTTFTDEIGKTWTAYGNAQISTAQSKFNGSSGYFDGTGSDYIDTPDHEDFNVGSGNFTIDFWAKRNATGVVHRICGQADASYASSSFGTLVQMWSDNKVYFAVFYGSSYVQAGSTATITDSNWHHIECCRDGNTLRIFIDGVPDGTADATGVTVNNATSKFAIGRVGEYDNQYFNGYIADFRFSKGIARHTTNFTPPTSPYADGTAIDHTINTDGSADISCEWEHDGVGDEYNIDGFTVLVHASDSDSAYTFGTTPSEEQKYSTSSEKRAFILPGVAANKYYTIGVQAYRKVDPDVDADGIILSNIVKPSVVSENPYQPSSSVAFAGDVSGTVAGVAADSISKTPASVVVGDGSTSFDTRRADIVVPAGSLNAQVYINQAIDSLPASGGKVILLEGTYKCNAQVLMLSNVTIEGQGPSTVLQSSNTTWTGLIENKDRTAKTNMVFSNLSIDGQTNQNRIGIRLNGCTNVIIKSVSIRNVAYEGILLLDSCDGVTISGCSITGPSTMDSAITLENVATNIVISNNTIDGPYDGINLKGTVGSVSTGIVVANNSIRNIVNYGGISVTRATSCVFTGNTITGCNYGIYADYLTHSSFTSNNIFSNSRDGIRLSNSSDNNVISDNALTGNGALTNNTYSHIWVYNGDYNTITNNCIRGGSGANKAKYGICISDVNSTGNYVVANDLYTAGVTGGLSDSGTSTVTTATNRV